MEHSDSQNENLNIMTNEISTNDKNANDNACYHKNNDKNNIINEKKNNNNDNRRNDQSIINNSIIHIRVVSVN